MFKFKYSSSKQLSKVVKDCQRVMRKLDIEEEVPLFFSFLRKITENVEFLSEIYSAGSFRVLIEQIVDSTSADEDIQLAAKQYFQDQPKIKREEKKATNTPASGSSSVAKLGLYKLSPISQKDKNEAKLTDAVTQEQLTACVVELRNLFTKNQEYYLQQVKQEKDIPFKTEEEQKQFIKKAADIISKTLEEHLKDLAGEVLYFLVVRDGEPSQEEEGVREPAVKKPKAASGTAGK